MRILSLTNCPLNPASGSGKTVLMYSQGLRDRGHQVDVVEPEQFTLWASLGRGRKFRQAIGAARELRRRQGQKDYDLIEFYGDEFWLAEWMLARRRARPFLVAHSNGLELLNHEREAQGHFGFERGIGKWKKRLFAPVHGFFSRVAFCTPDAFVGLCHLDRDYLVDHGFQSAERAAVVPPGLDLEYFPMGDLGAEPLRPVRVVFNGSWIPRKGTDTVVAVMSRLLAERPALDFHVLGTGLGPEQVRGEFPERVRGRITVHPRLSNGDLAEVLRGCRVFFFPTRYEGFGIALAEAMSCGCAAVTTPTGFGAELEPGVDGVVCPFDDVAVMTQAVGELLDNEPRRRRLALDGQNKTARMRWDVSCNLLGSLYEGWLEEWLGRRAERRGGSFLEVN